jgi:hypothetical protein
MKLTHHHVSPFALHEWHATLGLYCKGLDFKSKGIIGQEYENGAVAFIELQSGLKLALRPQQSLSLDSDLQLTPLCPTRFLLGPNVRSTAEIDAIMSLHRGATTPKATQHTLYSGYAAYFQGAECITGRGSGIHVGTQFNWSTQLSNLEYNDPPPH